MSKYKVQIDAFQGPLDLLLQLIEVKELEITKVSLSQVADEYVYYINNHSDISPEEIADFLVVAAKLILIKSKALLPVLGMEDEDAVDLERQLKMYKNFLEAANKINKIIQQGHFSYSKDKYPANLVQGFLPPKKVTSQKMRQVFELLLKKMEPVKIIPKKSIERVVSIKEKIQQIREQVFKQACLSFQKTICQSGDKAEKIVGFLAVLELIKQKIINVEQPDYLGDISIFKRSGAEHIQVTTESEFL